MNRATLALLAIVTAGIPVITDARAVAKHPAYPTKAIRFIIPFAPGGTPDTQARMLGDKLAQRLGQPARAPAATSAWRSSRRS